MAQQGLCLGELGCRIAICRASLPGRRGRGQQAGGQPLHQPPNSGFLLLGSMGCGLLLLPLLLMLMRLWGRCCRMLGHELLLPMLGVLWMSRLGRRL